jgi:predicted alpha/beta-fold hydrolase
MTSPLRQGKIISSDFTPPWWATNRHIQTIYPRFMQRRMPLTYQLERISLPDNDFVHLAWGPKPSAVKGIVVMFHGLEGSIHSHYANDAMASLSDNGWQLVLMHFRGCSGEMNLTPRAYHSGETSDPIFILNLLQQRYPNIPKVAIGYSLGANMLLKLLGENPQQDWLKAAIAVSAPLKLKECAQTMNQGFARVYQNYLLASMKKTLLAKMQCMDYSNYLSLTAAQVNAIKDFATFDNLVTAPLHGFVNGDDYYQQCSAYGYLKKIRCPTLILHARDDPFMNPNIVPKATDLSPSITLEISEKGGHVGFMQGRSSVWLHARVKQYFSSFLPTNVEESE